MNKHTPGPWELRISGIHSKDRFLCSVSAPSVSDHRQEGESWLEMYQRTEPERIAAQLEEIATSRLIAAAPELLEALKAFVADWCDETGMSSPSHESVRFAQAAIAKAEEQSCKS